METDFVTWLTTELESRGMTQAELSRRSGISTGSISDVVSRRRKVGREMATALAKGLELPVERVFQAAGFLPPEGQKHSREIEQIITIVEDMNPEEQREILSYIRWRNNLKKK